MGREEMLSGEGRLRMIKDDLDEGKDISLGQYLHWSPILFHADYDSMRIRADIQKEGYLENNRWMNSLPFRLCIRHEYVAIQFICTRRKETSRSVSFVMSEWRIGTETEILKIFEARDGIRVPDTPNGEYMWWVCAVLGFQGFQWTLFWPSLVLTTTSYKTIKRLR